MNAATKCLFGGALVAAGLATHEGQAQEFDFIDSSATAWTPQGTDTFSGPGTWSVESQYSYFGYGFATSWGMPTTLGLGAGGQTDTGTPGGEVSVLSRFTVTSSASATLDFSMISYGFGLYAELTLRDITTGDVLFFVNNSYGSQVFDFLPDHEYELSAAATYGYATMSINVPAPASAIMFGLTGVLALRRQRTDAKQTSPDHPSPLV